MTEKEKMLLGKLYDPSDGELRALNTKANALCLRYNVLPKTEWEKLVGKLNTLPFTKKVTRTFTRFFYSGATACEFDKSGRMSITSPLVSYAGLDKECIIIGVNDHLEIWDSKAFEEFMNDNSDIIEDIAENLFDGDKNAL